MGGDEFVFLLCGMEASAVDDRMDAIRVAVETASRRAVPGIAVIASLGAAAYPHDCTTAEELLALADRRMYEDKSDARGGFVTVVTQRDERGLEAALAS